MLDPREYCSVLLPLHLSNLTSRLLRRIITVIATWQNRRFEKPGEVHASSASKSKLETSIQEPNQRIEGTVLLEITVDEDGRAKHIRVTKALFFGLTQEAVATVQKWPFKPATGPDGRPAAVRQKVQVTSHLY
jgi:TonB family protein